MTCLFCNSKHISLSYFPDNLFNNKVFSYLKCDSCSLVFINPIPNSSDLVEMYPPSYQGEILLEVINIEEKMPGLRFNYVVQLDLIKKYNGNGSILDFGCGTAHFIYNAIINGLIINGVEFSNEVVTKLSILIPQVEFFTIEQFNKSVKKYNTIRISNVLEHFTNPIMEFNLLLTKLENDGVVLIEGPLEMNRSLVNWFKWNYLRIRKWMDDDYKTSHLPTHIIFSNKKNQLAFFENLGLKTLEYYIKENTWPYPEKIIDAKTGGLIVKYIIGKLSVLLSFIIPNYGNTFLYVGKKR